MITASDLRMVQQKHQEQYDALKQRLSEVEAERDTIGVLLDNAIGGLTTLRAEQTRLREALAGIVDCLPQPWGDSIVNGNVQATLSESSIDAAFAALSSTPTPEPSK